MSRSLRILHVSEAFGGGIVGVVAPLAERLTRAGHSVAVAYGVRPETPADVRNELSDDVEVFPLPWQRRTMREQVKAAAKGIRGADPRAEIVTAGMPDSHLSRPGDVFSYVKSLLRAGARGSFNTLAVNPYGKTSGQLLGKTRRFRSILNRGHDRSAKIWVTEFGWSDVGPASSFRAGSAGQARQIRHTIPALVKRRHRLHLRGLVYYSWRDGAPYPPLFKDFWGLHTGLLRKNGSPKPAFAAFKAAIASAR